MTEIGSTANSKSVGFEPAFEGPVNGRKVSCCNDRREREDFDRVAFSSQSPMDMRIEVSTLRDDAAIWEFYGSVYHAEAMRWEALTSD
jgi:hypothetical protein